MKINTSINQSLVDVALQYCGSIEQLYSIALANSKSVTDALVTGASLIVPSKSDVAQWLSSRGYNQSTSLVEDVATNEGIGYWAIELDFVVS